MAKKKTGPKRKGQSLPTSPDHARICRSCGVICPDFPAYEQHLDTFHTEILIKKCHFCDFSHRQREAVFHHVFLKHSKRPILEEIKCPRCLDYRATSLDLINFHLLNCLSKKPLKDKDPTEKRLTAENNPSETCLSEQKWTMEKSHDFKIVKAKSGPLKLVLAKTDSFSVFTCPHCDFQTDDGGQLGQHIVQDHVFCCKLCNFKTIGEQKLSAHCEEIHPQPFPAATAAPLKMTDAGEKSPKKGKISHNKGPKTSEKVPRKRKMSLEKGQKYPVKKLKSSGRNLNDDKCSVITTDKRRLKTTSEEEMSPKKGKMSLEKGQKYPVKKLKSSGGRHPNDDKFSVITADKRRLKPTSEDEMSPKKGKMSLEKGQKTTSVMKLKSSGGTNANDDDSDKSFPVITDKDAEKSTGQKRPSKLRSKIISKSPPRKKHENNCEVKASPVNTRSCKKANHVDQAIEDVIKSTESNQQPATALTTTPLTPSKGHRSVDKAIAKKTEKSNKAKKTYRFEHLDTWLKQNKYLPKAILTMLNGKICTTCNYDGPLRFDTIRHIRNKHLNTSFFSCNHCSYQNKYLRVLKSHFSDHHDNNEDFKVTVENVLEISTVKRSPLVVQQQHPAEILLPPNKKSLEVMQYQESTVSDDDMFDENASEDGFNVSIVSSISEAAHDLEHARIDVEAFVAIESNETITLIADAIGVEATELYETETEKIDNTLPQKQPNEPIVTLLETLQETGSKKTANQEPSTPVNKKRKSRQFLSQNDERQNTSRKCKKTLNDDSKTRDYDGYRTDEGRKTLLKRPTTFKGSKPSDEGPKTPEKGSQSPIIGPPDKGPETPDKGPETPENVSKTPDKGPKTPNKGPKTPVKMPIIGPPDKGPETPDKRPQTPDKGPETPENVSKTPDKGPKTPNKGPKTPVKVPIIGPPDKGPETPDKGPETPDKGPQTPDKGPETPENVSKTPDKGPKTPNKGPKTPVKVPIIGPPDKGPETPDKGPQTPDKRPETPENVSKTPNKGPKTPNKGPKTPAKVPETPEKGSKTPNKGPMTPDKGRPMTPEIGPKTTDIGPKTPDNAPETPAKGPKTPPKGSKTPSPSKKTPVNKTLKTRVKKGKVRTNRKLYDSILRAVEGKAFMMMKPIIREFFACSKCNFKTTVAKDWDVHRLAHYLVKSEEGENVAAENICPLIAEKNSPEKFISSLKKQKAKIGRPKKEQCKKCPEPIEENEVENGPKISENIEEMDPNIGLNQVQIGKNCPENLDNQQKPSDKNDKEGKKPLENIFYPISGEKNISPEKSVTPNKQKAKRGRPKKTHCKKGPEKLNQQNSIDENEVEYGPKIIENIEEIDPNIQINQVQIGKNCPENLDDQQKPFDKNDDVENGQNCKENDSNVSENEVDNGQDIVENSEENDVQIGKENVGQEQKLAFEDGNEGNMSLEEALSELINDNTCVLCRFKSVDMAKDHVRFAHLNNFKDTKCRVCSLTTDSLRQFVDHLKANHTKPKSKEELTNCKKCNLTFANNVELKEHQDDVHQDALLQCALCKFTTSSQSNLIDHVEKDHSNQTFNEVITIYDCPFCSEVLANPVDLSRHLKSLHAKDIKTCCCYCGEVRCSFASTFRHIDIIHLDIRKFPCTVCNHRFTCTRDLRNHSLTHRGIGVQA
jgi:hypothetical protein